MAYTKRMVEYVLLCVNEEYLERHPEYSNKYYPNGPYHLDQAYGGTKVVASWSGSGEWDLMGYYGTMREAYMFANGLWHGYTER